MSMLLVEIFAFTAILARITEFGFNPNRVAAFGENFMLLVNLGCAAVLYALFLIGRVPFVKLEQWQTACITVYLIWAWIVVALFPREAWVMPFFQYKGIK